VLGTPVKVHLLQDVYRWQTAATQVDRHAVQYDLHCYRSVSSVDRDCKLTLIPILAGGARYMTKGQSVSKRIRHARRFRSLAMKPIRNVMLTGMAGVDQSADKCKVVSVKLKSAQIGPYSILRDNIDRRLSVPRCAHSRPVLRSCEIGRHLSANDSG